MKITGVAINNFKGLDSVVFRPKTINILVGRNNTGKTSILESIAIGFIENFLSGYESKPSSVINYLQSGAEIEFELAGNPREVTRIEIRKSSIEEIIKSLRDELQKILEDLKRDGFAYLASRYSSPETLARNRKLLKSLDNAALQASIDKSFETIDKETIVDVADECIVVRLNNIVNQYMGIKYSQTLRSLLRNFESILLKDVLNIKVEPSRRTALDFYWSIGLARTNIFDIGVEPVITRKKEPSATVNAIYVKDPIKYLKSLRDKGENLQKLAFDIESIIKSEGVVPNMLRFNFDSIVFETSEGNKEVSMNMMGDGFRTLVSILSVLKSSPKGSIILLEEPEVHLHPGYVKQFVRYLISLSRSTNIQLFISTHSYDLIEYLILDETMPKEDREFLDREMMVLRLSRTDDTVVSEEMDYPTVSSSLKNLLLDLRGV